VTEQLDLWFSLGWRDCADAECAAEHGPWPLREFLDDPKGLLCSVCYGEKVKVRRPCKGCGRTVQTVAKHQTPTCVKCRRKRRNGLKAMHRWRARKRVAA
jgi:hypothetical protein